MPAGWGYETTGRRLSTGLVWAVVEVCTSDEQTSTEVKGRYVGGILDRDGRDAFGKRDIQATSRAGVVVVHEWSDASVVYDA